MTSKARLGSRILRLSPAQWCGKNCYASPSRFRNISDLHKIVENITINIHVSTIQLKKYNITNTVDVCCGAFSTRMPLPNYHLKCACLSVCYTCMHLLHAHLLVSIYLRTINLWWSFVCFPRSHIHGVMFASFWARLFPLCIFPL